MRKFFEKVKNFGSVIKFLSFLSDALSAVVSVYEKHYGVVKEVVNNDVQS